MKINCRNNFPLHIVLHPLLLKNNNLRKLNSLRRRRNHITFISYNYSFRVVVEATIDDAVVAVAEVVGGITADGLTADLAAKLFRANLSRLQ